MCLIAARVKSGGFVEEREIALFDAT